jgi:hypothetical protein
MIRSRVSSRVKRLRAKWVDVIEVMNNIIHHLFALSNVGMTIGLLSVFLCL